jgi:hypothetical protein
MDNIVKFPYDACRRVHSRKQRRSKNGTPEERAAKAQAASGNSTSASVVKISGPNSDNPRAADPAARSDWVKFFQYLRTKIVQEFARGKDIDQIFDQIIASIPSDFR